LLSVTEGEDKPLKYPGIFKSSGVALLTKCDLIDAVGFDLAGALQNIRDIAPQARILQTSARSHEGLEEWCEFLTSELNRKRTVSKSEATGPR
jgi:hydrogenase nickel incorporation protein HypB